MDDDAAFDIAEEDIGAAWDGNIDVIIKIPAVKQDIARIIFLHKMKDMHSRLATKHERQIEILRTHQFDPLS